MEKYNLLYQTLGIEYDEKRHSSIDSKISQFQKSTGFVLPPDLREYFCLLGGTESQYNERLYRFFSINDFKRISEELKIFNGIPDYTNIINTLAEYRECFVFSDYLYHMFSYAIRLYDRDSEKNEVYIICGDKYKIIANSFSEFIELYLSESIKLQFED